MARTDRPTDHALMWCLRCGIAWVLAALLFLMQSSECLADQVAGADDAGLVAELLQLVEDNDLDAVVETVARIDITKSSSTRTLAAIIQAARKCVADGRRDDAAEIYHTGAALSETLLADADSGLPVERATAIWSVAADSLTSTGRHADALRWLSLAAEKSSDPTTNNRTGESLLAVASGALDVGDKLTAGHAYRRAIEMFASGGMSDSGEGESAHPSIATARLGYAWTLVMAAGESGNEKHLQQSLAAVDTFLQHHPEHPDAASALLLKLSCQTRLDAFDDAALTRAELVRQHPRSSSTAEMIVMLCAARDETGQTIELDETVREYLINHHDFLLSTHATKANVDVVKTALLAAAVAGAPDAEMAYATALALCDEVGDVATQVLHRLQELGHAAEAQRIAVRWLGARDESRHNPNSQIAKMQIQAGVLSTGAVREAACRWAGRTGAWSMLAMAADEEPGLYDRPGAQASQEEAMRRGRTLHVERLFAEALLQTGKTKQSLKLWERIVDEHGADDFPTLLRLAEACVAAGSVTDASSRIAAAQAAALQQGAAAGGNGRSSPEVALTNLLAANLEIRQLRFDHGRALLEQIVRSSRADADLRGRAQWMIGETFFMQEKFSDAIAAYRHVEAIGSSDQWTAAALVQAGKSFEQLGRTREASVCYSTLVSRFGDSPHAGGARRRLAAMTTDGPSAPGTIRR